MTGKSSFTAALKKQLTADWQRKFPGLSVYEPLRLMRRVGPLLIGILLERSRAGDSYRPFFHIHNLARAFPVVSKSQPVETTTPYIRVATHAEHLDAASERLGRAAYLPTSGPVSLDQIEEGFRQYLNASLDKFQPDAFEDLALIAGCAGDAARARRLISQATTVMQSWPADLLTSLGGLTGWASRLDAAVCDPDALHAIVASEVEKHGLGAVPVEPIQGAG
jgi:hypothetical protein